jgi:polyferredoxin
MVMDRVDKPRGLIRYDSAEGIVSGTRRLWTPRVIGYAAVLCVLGTVLIYLLAIRTPLDVTILRTPGMFYQEQPDARISNIYDLKVLNKTFDPVPISLKLLDQPGEVQVMGDAITVAPQAAADAKLFVFLPRRSIQRLNTPVRIAVYAGVKQIDVVSTSFLGPVNTP